MEPFGLRCRQETPEEQFDSSNVRHRATTRGSQTKSLRWELGVSLLAICLVLPTHANAFVIFQDAGANAAAIQDTVDAYRAALGDPVNGNNPGPLAAGRREINWDGGGPPVVDASPPVTPFVVFQNTRGATFTTLGTGLTQAAATGGSGSLDTINPTYNTLFAPFSPNRLFTPIGNNVTQGVFSIPGTGGAALAGVSGFGAVFSDVDLAGSTIAYFDEGNGLIGTFGVPTISGNQTFSFLGLVLGPGEGLVRRIVITTGNSALGPDESSTTDLVVMDDFFYGEPQRIPEPDALLLAGSALIMTFVIARRRRRH